MPSRDWLVCIGRKAVRQANEGVGFWGVSVSGIQPGADCSRLGLGKLLFSQGSLSRMTPIARARRASAGEVQGHSDTPRRTSTSGLIVLPRSCGDVSVAGAELEKTGRAPSSRSRFLEVRNENVCGSQWCQIKGNAAQTVTGHVARSPPGSAFHTRSSSTLRKVAQLESKIMNRRKQMESQNTDLGLKSLGEESSSSASSHEHSARGKKYPKSYATASGNMTHSNACSKEEENIKSLKKNIVVKPQLGLDGGEEEMREVMDNSLDFSCGNENWRSVGKIPISSEMPPPSQKAASPAEVSKASYYSKDLMKNGFGGVNSPTPLASRNLSVHHNMRSQALSSVKDSTVKITLLGTDNTKQLQISLESDRSEIKSLDDMFSKAADSEDFISRSSDGFRLNILSLDDLTPNTTSEAVELKQKETDIQITQGSNRNPKKDTSLVEKDQASLKMACAITGMNDASEGDDENNVTEAEISEHLSGVSADSPRHKQDYLYHDETIFNSAYSEDFERSLVATDRGSVLKESEYSESCTYSGKHPSSASSPSSTRKLCGQACRVTVKETGVQTVDPSFTYCWPKANTSAVLDPPVGNSYVDPVPIASHVISMDAVEALTAYIPSVLVLNAMLKQHLMLTQQFVENIRHLHLSIVESLENEKFHYHTLEEAKEYISAHRSARLTINQVHEEIGRAQEEKLP
ncbi:uncharacterized protein C19orf44 homolog [Indicator indicator]|uniref:uncharacterized protein C19orf44 homolog n=1 Tax=Indicator indicator TaxID=1002788 RepID=UPI0023DF51D0|nr:uncharacterized protein C19orf44 homolog [Indicator indicator]